MNRDPEDLDPETNEAARELFRDADPRGIFAIGPIPDDHDGPYRPSADEVVEAAIACQELESRHARLEKSLRLDQLRQALNTEREQA